MATKIDRCPHCGSKTVKVSWSSLKTWEECRQKSHLQRSRKKVAMQDVRNFFPGRITDRVVRDWLNDDPRSNPRAMAAMVRPTIERELAGLGDGGEFVAWRDKSDLEFVVEQCTEAVTAIEPDLETYVLPFEWQVDYGFKAPLLMRAPDGGMDRVVLNGYMDIIVHDPATDEWKIYDVKNTLDTSYWRGSRGQLSFYALANQIMTGKLPVEVGFLQPLIAERVKRFEVTGTEVNAIAGRIQAMVDMVWRGDNEPRTDTKVCTFCEVKHACSKFRAVEDGKHRRAPLF